MNDFAPLIFAIVGLVISYSLYKFFSDNNLKIFLLVNAIIQFVISAATTNGISIIIAILSFLPVIFSKKGSDESGE